MNALRMRRDVRPSRLTSRVRAAWIAGSFAFVLHVCGCASEPANASADEADAGASLVAQGETVVTQRACANCHRPSDDAGVLSGRTVPLLGTQTFPRNLTPDVATGLGAWRDDQIEVAITDGLDRRLEPLCGMPNFHLTINELQAVVAYLRSLPSVHRVIPASVCEERAGLDETGH